MKKILFFVLISVSFQTSAQCVRRNSTESEIRSECGYQNYKINFTDSGIRYLSFTNDEGTINHYFNEDGYAYVVIFFPANQGKLNTYVEKYNNQYVIVSDSQWKMYNNNGIMKIELIFAEDGGYYFIYSK